MFCFGKSSNVCDQPPTQIVISFDSRRETRSACSQGAFCSSQIGRVTFVSPDRKEGGEAGDGKSARGGNRLWRHCLLLSVFHWSVIVSVFVSTISYEKEERKSKVAALSVCLMLFIQSPLPAAVPCPCLLIYRSATTNGCSAFGQTCYAVNQWVELNMLPKPCHFIFPQNR